MLATSPTAGTAKGAVADGGSIDSDLACRLCEYNLRGLRRADRCPECGEPVAASLEGNLARTADPGWLIELAEGTRWIFIGLLVVSVAGGAVQLVTSLTSVPQRYGHPAALLLILPLAIGIWRFSTPPRRDDPIARSGALVWWQRLVRFTLLPAMALWPTAIWHRNTMAGPVLAIEIAAELFGLVGLSAAFLYGRQLARRLPDVKLVRQMRACMIGVAIAFILSAVFRPPWLALVSNTIPPVHIQFRRNSLIWTGWRLSLELVLALVGLCTLWTLLLLAWCRARLRSAARIARARRESGRGLLDHEGHEDAKDTKKDVT